MASHGQINTILDWILLPLVTFLISEFLHRILIFLNEYRNYKTHYPILKRYKIMWEYSFTFEPRAYKLICITILLFAIATTLTENIQEYFLKYMDSFKFGLGYIIFQWFKMSKSRISAAEWIRSQSGIDYATGMASNYFHGYLNFQLPHKGDGKKGFHERVEDYEDKHDVKFALNRLIILIPDSLHTQPKIKSEYLERVEPLEVFVKDRAGVERPFRNDVYRFTKEINDERYYISVEGATPLLSFLEAMNDNLTSTAEMKAMHREILIQFYKSVKYFTSTCPGTANEVEILYYADKTADNKQVDVGEVLMNHIKRILAKSSENNT